MIKKLKRLATFIKPPRLTAGNPQLRGSFTSIDGSAEREAREYNQAEIARASYEVTKEAFQKNLNLAYGALITSIIASVVATIALIVTIVKN
jgi:hypothetical protein